MQRLGFIHGFVLSIVLLLPLPAAAQSKYRGVTVSSGITAADIEDLADWNPNFVRYLLTWGDNADTATLEQYYAWLESALLELDALLPVFAQHNMQVMIVLYSPPGGHVLHDPPWPLHRVFAEQWAQDALITTWAIIATRYSNNPAVYGFDLLNEPAHDPKLRKHPLTGARLPRKLKKWEKLAPFLAKFVLTVAPFKNVIIEPPYSLPQFFPKVKIIKDPRVKYSFHFYEPFFFTHQGLYGIPSGLVYPNAVNNIISLQLLLAPVDKFQKKLTRALRKFVPATQIGEFLIMGEASVVRWAPEDSALAYLTDLINIFESRGWTWVYHSFRESHVWSAEHTTDPGNLDPSPVMTRREELLRSAFSLNQ